MTFAVNVVGKQAITCLEPPSLTRRGRHFQFPTQERDQLASRWCVEVHICPVVGRLAETDRGGRDVSQGKELRHRSANVVGRWDVDIGKVSIAGLVRIYPNQFQDALRRSLGGTVR